MRFALELGNCVGKGTQTVDLLTVDQPRKNVLVVIGKVILISARVKIEQANFKTH